MMTSFAEMRRFIMNINRISIERLLKTQSILNDIKTTGGISRGEQFLLDKVNAELIARKVI